MPKALSQQELMQMLWGRRGPADGECPIVPEGMTARDVYAGIVQQQLGATYDQDFSDYSTAQTLDSIEYFLFPNLFIFPGLTLPMVYRFRPDKDDPDYSYFDLYFLRPKPPSSKSNHRRRQNRWMPAIDDHAPRCLKVWVFLALFTIRILTTWPHKHVGLKPAPKVDKP